MHLIRVLLFPPGQTAELCSVARDHVAFRKLLGTETLAWYHLIYERATYILVCDDEAVVKDLTPHRVCRHSRYLNWPMRGAFLVCRFDGIEDEESLRPEDVAIVLSLFPQMPPARLHAAAAEASDGD